MARDQGYANCGGRLGWIKSGPGAEGKWSGGDVRLGRSSSNYGLTCGDLLVTLTANWLVVNWSILLISASSLLIIVRIAASPNGPILIPRHNHAIVCPIRIPSLHLPTSPIVIHVISFHGHLLHPSAPGCLHHEQTAEAHVETQGGPHHDVPEAGCVRIPIVVQPRWLVFANIVVHFLSLFLWMSISTCLSVLYFASKLLSIIVSISTYWIDIDR